MKYLALFAALFTTGFTVLAWAADYTVDTTASTLTFSGEHAGKAFTGTFETWDATITFDPENLAESQVTATFNLASAKTGDAMYDGTLPTGDWFDVNTHPTGTFETTEIKHLKDETYQATGNLTLRGQTHPLTANVTIAGLETDTVTAQSTFTLNRLTYGIGEKSDPNAEWVSADITLNLELQATPQ